MQQLNGFAATENASLYMKKLCRHFGHKVPATFDDERGRIEFPFGECELVARPEGLQLRCSAEADQAERMKDVMESHLLRFASKETLQLNWQ